METEKTRQAANRQSKGSDRIENLIILCMSILLVLILVLALRNYHTHPLVEGSEKTYYGTVVDRAISEVVIGDRHPRPYIGVRFPDGAEVCFWEHKDCRTDAKIGDRVTIESAIEEGTGLLIAVRVTVHEQGETE